MAKPSFGQGVLCVVGFVGLQVLFNWMDAAPIDDLLVAGAILGLALAAWVVYRSTRGNV